MDYISQLKDIEWRNELSFLLKKNQWNIASRKLTLLLSSKIDSERMAQSMLQKDKPKNDQEYLYSSRKKQIF
jgi:hypothetical protein